MADLKKRLKQNVHGNYFVDSTCINCDTCRQLAPNTFEDSGDYSFVQNQPESDNEIREATRALLACPTGSIGTIEKNILQETINDFPLSIEDEVYYCGFNSPKSYGGNSYFIKLKEGNWLIDSPKFNNHLLNSFEKMGGIKYIFLTHSDDVADAEKYAIKFGSTRIIHKEEQDAQPNAEHIIDGTNTIEFNKDFKIIPTPGHTKGHCVLLYKSKYLFTGDHLRWNRYKKCLHASKDVCWFDWQEQANSMEKLKDYQFEWILPGHGQNIKLPIQIMKTELEDLIKRMKEINQQ
ncbi:MAG: MBL fold metallo-hydrolase [Candidatus Melainabacteria bacterium]|nr:MBL fold metallo-hydrolase [Candidatus Melainabacteria bacterium]